MNAKISEVIEAGRVLPRSEMDLLPSTFRVYSLEEVAEMTSLSLRRIQKDCRRKRVEHVQHGRGRGMTVDQIHKMLTAYTVAAEWAEELNDAQLCIEMTRRSGARRASRGRAA